MGASGTLSQTCGGEGDVRWSPDVIYLYRSIGVGAVQQTRLRLDPSDRVLTKNAEALQRSYNLARSKWSPNFEWSVNSTSSWTLFNRHLADTSVTLARTWGAHRREMVCPLDIESRSLRRKKRDVF
jgi:hypothetical protein